MLINCHTFELGDGSQVNSGAKIVGGGNVTIGKHSVIGYNAVLLTRTDTPNSKYVCDSMPEEKRRIFSGEIIIGDNCFIGSNSIIMPSVTIGDGAVIGAGAYIDHDVQPWKIIIPTKNYVTRDRKQFLY